MVVFEFAEADFGALEVLDDGDRATFFGSGVSNPRDLFVAFEIVAMGKVQAATVDARHDEVGDGIFGHDSGADGGQDFGAFE